MEAEDRSSVKRQRKDTLCWKCGSTDHWSGNCPDKEKILGWPFAPKKEKKESSEFEFVTKSLDKIHEELTLIRMDLNKLLLVCSHCLNSK